MCPAWQDLFWKHQFDCVFLGSLPCLSNLKQALLCSIFHSVSEVFILSKVYWPWDTSPDDDAQTVCLCPDRPGWIWVCVYDSPKDWHGDIEIDRGRGEGSGSIHLHSSLHRRTSEVPYKVNNNINQLWPWTKKHYKLTNGWLLWYLSSVEKNEVLPCAGNTILPKTQYLHIYTQNVYIHILISPLNHYINVKFNPLMHKLIPV